MPRPGLRHYVVAGTVLIGAGLVAGGLFIISGLYNVSAARDHIDLTTWLLDVVRRQSVRTHSLGIEPPPLDDPSMARLGARYFEAGCAPCHGAPGRPASAVRGAMLPSPPPLSEAAGDWSDAELFWIVRNGQKYTGMPSWIAPEREDEVWPVVALLRQLDQIDPDEYAELAALDELESDGAPFLDGPDAQLPLCASCHGEPDGLPVHESVPRLGGQHADYLARSLRNYASGTRESGVMQLFAADLSEDEIVALAAAYAAGGPPADSSEPVGNVGAGAAIYELGLPEQDVPACVACHRESRAADFPRLASQSAPYVRQQLANWREGLRRVGPHGQIMARIAERLTEEQARDVAAYVDTLPPVGTSTP